MQVREDVDERDRLHRLPVRIHKKAKEAVDHFAEGDEQRGMLMGAKRFTKSTDLNTAALQKLVAKQMNAAGKNPF